jgi:hypothetical protein
MIVPDISLVEFMRARLDEREQVAADWPNEHLPPPPDGVPFWLDANGHPICEPRTFVLADVEAKRRILGEHAEYETSDQWDGPLIGRGQCRRCAEWEEVDYDGPPHVDWPCTTLRLLALPHANHPDYRQEWKP